MASKNLLPNNISADQFKQQLSRYPALIESISRSKASKPGQKTLVELDKFRYDDGPKLFSTQKPKRAMNHDDVKTLVEWKLRHGKFRPTLMNLVSSNEESFVKETIEKSTKGYWANLDTNKTLDGITKLKGIGPATASLLLSVHDPERVIFFSDEAFYWLCCDGKKSPIKYNTKEYQELNTAAVDLVKRLKISAIDVEKVAYMVMKQEDGPVVATNEKHATLPKVQLAKGNCAKVPTAKRKEKPEDEMTLAHPVRRSKRGKVS